MHLVYLRRCFLQPLQLFWLFIDEILEDEAEEVRTFLFVTLGISPTQVKPGRY